MRLRTTLPEQRRGSERGISLDLGRRVSRADAPESVTSPTRAGLPCEAALARNSLTEIWLARLPNGGRCVVKCATDAYATDRGVARLIEREWTFLHAGASPGVVAAYGLERSERGPVLVTEYLPNGDLVTLAGSHPRHWAAALHGLAGTLQALHGRGIVHRDIKPRNILLDGLERATLIDFASAAYRGERAPAGGTTEAYSRPDRRPGAEVTAAEDEHAFAAVLYELLAGRPPYDTGLGGAAGGCFVPLHAEPSALADEPAIRDLAAIVDAALDADAKEPDSLLEVFQSALDAIIATR